MASQAEYPAPAGKKKPDLAPQKTLSDFWDKYIVKTPEKVTRIFPQSLFASLLPDGLAEKAPQNESATASYDAAAQECRQKVERIVRECRRTNEKWSDPDFNLDSPSCRHGLVDTEDYGFGINAEDLKSALNTLNAVTNATPSLQMFDLEKLLDVLENKVEWGSPTPGSVHTVDFIYDKPKFTIDGFGTSDVQQGKSGDCWWVAAVAALCSIPDLVERVCVAQDEKCGVYGFVFHRDGEWLSTVVDDSLYLSVPDFDKSSAYKYDPSGTEARKWKQRHQTGSEALMFAKCADQNETWLPLLEKAYAKIHGDYDAIEGGFPGEGLEDMTGGVTTSLDPSKVLEKDKLWQELSNPDKDFIFSAWTGPPGSDVGSRIGLAYGHAYSILKAVEVEDESGGKVKLVRIRNPWGHKDSTGEGEWNGPWSDGSKEWTPYWLSKLDYKFDDDGMFWMSYEDMLSRFIRLDRTRLFGEDWKVVQQWTNINVSWLTGYINTKFVIEIKKSGLYVFVLSKLDERYFQGLEGQYSFELHFLLKKEGSDVGDHLARASPSMGSAQRSVSAEIDLEPGKYEVIPKIVATKDEDKDPVQDVVKEWAEKKPQKLRQIGLNYDFAHSKAIPRMKKAGDVKTEPDQKIDKKEETLGDRGPPEEETKEEVKPEEEKLKEKEETPMDEETAKVSIPTNNI
ncbi:putative calpain family cysteine protease protein [Neofusicoccum parvum UCRNP2]|uniref:Putative calpain family cysteine protease protein n=1 Tax=Botryosphaeria parva (strain UCR-NP2) TaxID=1287680 RepID=R1G650_BOTPV|nr:putative calpain family cysteine protease protein [Neofusicoccum parvum UCRNP2]